MGYEEVRILMNIDSGEKFFALTLVRVLKSGLKNNICATSSSSAGGGRPPPLPRHAGRQTCRGGVLSTRVKDVRVLAGSAATSTWSMEGGRSHGAAVERGGGPWQRETPQDGKWRNWPSHQSLQYMGSDQTHVVGVVVPGALMRHKGCDCGSLGLARLWWFVMLSTASRAVVAPSAIVVAARVGVEPEGGG
ncbi:hypothetical protein BJV78DRAFT_1152667 [Lactifluus subvellereus]|nr:hypothetical protein BJV78DRAFT_1152667 [Lactifluus subvellereus]